MNSIFCRDCRNQINVEDSKKHVCCSKNPRFIHHTRLLKDLERSCKFYDPIDEVKKMITRPKPGERCLILKISFSEQTNSYEYQNILEADLEFLATGNQMQSFFNSITPDIRKKEGWILGETK